jgi:hypothetical protein
MIIFPTAFVFTQTPMGLIEEPAARLAGYGQECGLLRKSRRLGSDAVAEEHGSHSFERLMVKNPSAEPRVDDDAAFAKTRVGSRLNERTAENCIRTKARIRSRRHTPLWRFDRRITAQRFN